MPHKVTIRIELYGPMQGHIDINYHSFSPRGKWDKAGRESAVTIAANQLKRKKDMKREGIAVPKQKQKQKTQYCLLKLYLQFIIKWYANIFSPV